MSRAIPNLWLPPRKRIVIPCLRCGKPRKPWRSPLAWAMGHLKKSAHHLVKHSHHLVKGCPTTYIEANICGGDTGANIWFQLNDDGTIYFPDTAGGISVDLPLYFSSGDVCYEVKVGNPTDASPGGSIVTDVTTLDTKSGCTCLDDVDAYYAVRDCCFNEIAGYVLQSALTEWQTDNATITTTFVRNGRCFYVDAQHWSFTPTGTIFNLGDYSPAEDGCDDTACTCCCGVFCCPEGTVITATVSYSFEVTDDMSGNPCIGTHSGTLSGTAITGVTPGGSRFLNDAEEDDAALDFLIGACDPAKFGGGIYVAGGSGIQDPNGSGCGAQTSVDIPIGPEGGSGSFDSVFPNPPGGSGSFSVTLSGC